jgi:hypothetical protein
MVAELINKYLWLVETLRGGGDRGLAFVDICRKYRSEFHEDYPRRTFNNHREAIADAFGIEIACDRSTNRYYIPFVDDALDRDASKQWLINTFTVNNLLSGSRDRLSGRVSVEDIPSGQKYLTTVMQAMLDDRKMTLRYRRYMGEEEVRHIRPYAVKEFAKRWYVVAFSEEAGAVRVYAMDRILSLEISEGKFRMPPGFRVDELFEDSYGIYPPEGEEPVLVKLRTTAREAAYLRDLPLHQSQVFLGTDEGGRSIFALRLIPNPNFVMELCKHGNRLEVLEPESLRRQVADELRNALKMYE